MHINDIIEDAAKECAGNWRKFESFAWHDEPETDSDKWFICNTTNRDADLLTQSNHACIAKELEPFMSGDDPDVRTHGASHWAVGWTEGFEIRVYNSAGAITDAFKAYQTLVIALEEYPVLDDSDHSNREYEAAIDAIKDVGSRYCDTINAPEDWAGEVFSWLWTNDQGELENTDGNGASPSKDSVVAALTALGYLETEDEG